MRRLVFVSSEPKFGESIIAGLPSDVELVASDGDLERILSALRAGPVEVLWDLSAEWLSPQMLLELLSDEQIERSRWLWLRREQTRFEDIPEVGESLLLPMAPQLIVARLYPRRSSVQPEIRGAFEAMSLPDLLQTLGMNQRDVRVTLDFNGESGVLELRSGYLALARFRGHQGMKAMCRILEQEGGTFSMSDATDSASTSLIASVGEALMMAIQFKDEKANLLEEFFKEPRALLCRSATMSCPVGDATKEFELWQYLERPNTVRTLVERSSLPDAMVLKVLRDWIEVGAIKFQHPSEANTVFLGSAFERRLSSGVVAAKVQEFVCICATRKDLELVHEAWRSIDGFIESGVESESSAISELGSLYHFSARRRYPVLCWVGDRGDLRPWAKWRANTSLFLMHRGAEGSALAECLLGDATFLATREVGLSGVDILRGLERLVARLS